MPAVHESPSPPLFGDDNPLLKSHPVEAAVLGVVFEQDRLLLACVQHTAVHRKYGDFLEASRRYGAAMGLAELQ